MTAPQQSKLNLMYQEANKTFYDIDGQINNLYNMHSRTSDNNREMSESDIELVRDRI